MMLPYIVGFQKCGINSLIKHYRKQYGESASIHATEDITSPDCVEKFQVFQNTHFPVAITRNKVDAVWSMYTYFGYYKTMTIQEFLAINKPHAFWQNENPLFRVDYEYHLSKLEDYGLVVLKLEDMGDLFPKENTTKANVKRTDVHDVIIQKALDNYDLVDYL